MIDLTNFCNPDRKILKNPIKYGDYIYASDGKIAIRIDNKMSIKEFPDLILNIETPEIVKQVCNDSVISKIEDIIDKNKHGINLNFVYEKKLPEYNECICCKGKGIINKCNECNGTGMVECGECGNEKDCKECDGFGTINERKCNECNGTGKILKNSESILTEGLKVKSEYLNIIYENFKNVSLYSNGIKKPIYFTFDGGEGILMPLAY